LRARVTIPRETEQVLLVSEKLAKGLRKSMTQKLDEFVQELQESILEGYLEKLKNEFLNPENIRKIEESDGYISIKGVCGDTIEMYVFIRDGRISNIKFMINGCGPTMACASYVARTVKGRTIDEALRIKPEDVDRYFEGLPEEHEHCAKLSVLTLKGVIKNYLNDLEETNE
jgi:nitrogen fixation NifU-like protein